MASEEIDPRDLYIKYTYFANIVLMIFLNKHEFIFLKI